MSEEIRKMIDKVNNFGKSQVNEQTENSIGEFTYVILKDISITKYKGKVDTGADSCSLHSNYQKEEDGVLSYKVLDIKKIFKTKNFKKTDVKTSNGQSVNRYKIKLNIIIDGNEYESDFTLNDRDSMSYPILIGKNLIKNNFTIEL